MATIDYTNTQAVSTINYVGESAMKAMYRRLKRRIDSVSAEHGSILSRLDVIEAEAKNVIALTDDELLAITEEARKEDEWQVKVAIDYTKTTIKYT